MSNVQYYIFLAVCISLTSADHHANGVYTGDGLMFLTHRLDRSCLLSMLLSSPSLISLVLITDMAAHLHIVDVINIA